MKTHRTVAEAHCLTKQNIQVGFKIAGITGDTSRATLSLDLQNRADGAGASRVRPEETEHTGNRQPQGPSLWGMCPVKLCKHGGLYQNGPDSGHKRNPDRSHRADRFPTAQ